jgi:hypothetical protein
MKTNRRTGELRADGEQNSTSSTSRRNTGDLFLEEIAKWKLYFSLMLFRLKFFQILLGRTILLLMTRLADRSVILLPRRHAEEGQSSTRQSMRMCVQLPPWSKWRRYPGFAPARHATSHEATKNGCKSINACDLQEDGTE